MKKITLVAFLVFGIGFAIKPFHLPFNAILMLAGITLMFVSNVLSIWNKTVSGAEKLVGFATTACVVATFASLKFLPAAFILLVLGTIISIAGYAWAAQAAKLNRTMLLVACMAVAWAVFMVPTDVRFYNLNLRWSVEAESDFISWDKYSWFLYQNGNTDEALRISEKALRIAEASGDRAWIEKIKEHQSSIAIHSWETYH